MRIQQIDSLEDTPGLHWNRLVNGNPFLRHEFLLALEQNNCVGEEFGWHSRHLLLHDNQNRLRGAIPLYLKTNSYGELVFDWSWADAYQRAGLAYYPKLVSAIPYTPATGPRLLTQSDDSAVIGAALIQAARNLIATEHCSSLHWLFPHSDDCARLECEGFMKREDIQFHWSNQGYQNFDDFLSRLSAKRRKEIRRERRLVAEAGISFKSLIGADACDEDWQAINDFYQRTFDEKWGVPTLNLGFFRQIGAQMGEQILLIFAYRNKRRIAGALCFFSDKVLYGRHWGAIEHHRGLHFETCYYQGIEFCIDRGLQSFEPGAQGEYKIARGFLPTRTTSLHWIEHPEFRAGIEKFLHAECRQIRDYAQELMSRSPFRHHT